MRMVEGHGIPGLRWSRIVAGSLIMLRPASGYASNPSWVLSGQDSLERSSLQLGYGMWATSVGELKAIKIMRTRVCTSPLLRLIACISRGCRSERGIAGAGLLRAVPPWLATAAQRCAKGRGA